VALGLAIASIIGVSAEGAPLALGNGVEISSTLVGNPAGAFSVYKIAYPGGTDVDITLTYQPSDPVTSSAFGFNVYGDGGYQGQGVANGELGALKLNYRADDPSTLLVQVYNYLDGAPVAYQLVTSGLPEATSAPAAALAQPDAAQPAAAPATATNQPLNGSTTGNPGGGIQLHQIAYPGDGETTTLTLTFSPDDPSYSPAIGFKVYDPMGNLVAEGQAIEAPAMRTATIATAVAGPYTVQIYDYVEGLTIAYTLVASR
jgi:hypothetical protein